MDQRPPTVPPLEWVRAFEAAARLGSFTAAAVETGLTQPAISQRIAQLEAHLGTALFLRRARAISLTVEGEAWLPHVQTALGMLGDSAERLFSAGRKQLTISASGSVIALWLMPRLAALQRATGAAISLQSLVLGGQSAALDDTIQIRYGRGGWPHPYQAPLFAERLAPVISPDRATQAWDRLPRIACTGPRADWSAYDARYGPLSAPPARPMTTLRVDTFHAALLAAKQGLGVALGSLPLCRDALTQGNVAQVGQGVLDSDQTYWIVAAKAAISPAQWEALTQILCD